LGFFAVSAATVALGACGGDDNSLSGSAGPAGTVPSVKTSDKLTKPVLGGTQGEQVTTAFSQVVGG
jgi:hypothetical protein